MILFLLLGPPLLLALANMMIYRENILTLRFWTPYIRGILVSVIAAFILLLFNNGYRITYSAGNLYFYCLMFYGIIPLLFAQGAYIFFDFVLKNQPAEKKEIRYITYLCGYFTSVSFFVYLIRINIPEYYILFYNPVIYISLTVIISLLSMIILDRGSEVLTYILFGSTVFISFLTAFIPFLYYTNHFFLALLLTIIVLGSGTASFIFLRQKQPRRDRDRLVPLI